MEFEGIFQDDGNLVIYDAAGGVIWATGTSEVGATSLDVQTDENVVIYGPNGALWATNTAGKGPSYFVLFNGQFLVVQQSTNIITWVSLYTSALTSYYKKADPKNSGKGPIQRLVGATLHLASFGLHL